MYPSQNNISNNSYKSNIPGFISNNLPQITATTAIQGENSSNINCNDPSCSCFSGINNNNNIVPTQTSIFPDHNNNQKQ